MSVNEKMTAIADAIRGKTGKTGTLTLDQMAMEIAGIQVGGGSGGGIEPTASYLNTPGEINGAIRLYPFKPRYKNELIVWNMTGTSAPTVGSTTCYAFFLWIINGAIPEAGWVAGEQHTAPWTDANYKYQRRSGSFSFDESGNLTVPAGTWGYTGYNTCTIYEIPLPIGPEV